MKLFVLGTGLLRRGDSVLLVRCQYENEPHPLWALPGGGQEAGETLAATVRREFLEETSLEIEVADVAYVSESLDSTRDLHVINCTFWAREADPSIQPRSADSKVVEARFVPITQAPELLQADVICIPVVAALRGQTQPHYYSFSEKDIAVPFFGRHKSGASRAVDPQ
jgi:ADP-ribose pyrophosphatase YjhB (NUDIX family)